MKILGISAFYHDSAASIIVGDKIVAAAQEERFSRKKHDARFPSNAIRYCLDEVNLDLKEIDVIVFYDKPFLKFERLLETYYAFSPRGIISFLKAMPIWLKEKLFLKKIIRNELKKIGTIDTEKTNILFPEHHLSHAASAFYPSPFTEAAILTIDGVGEWASASICIGKGKDITVLKEMHFPHSLGLLYTAFTYFLGFKVNSGEYKLMGLAPYGNPSSEQTHKFIHTIENTLIKIYDDGSIWINQKYFNYAQGLRMVKDKKWEILFGIKKRNEGDEFSQEHANLAFAIQAVTEKIVLKLVKHAKEITGLKNICLSGGVALNCVANGKIIQEGIFENVFIQPASGDAGGSLGAALAAKHIYFGEERKIQTSDAMQGSYLGNSYQHFEIEKFIQKKKAVATYFPNEHDLLERIAQYIYEGKIIGFFQGRMEFGPRALGNRSIIGDPRSPEMQKRMNLNIKYRESFRPFAPSVLEEDAHLFFDIKNASPYMLQVAEVKKEIRTSLPSDYEQRNIKDKLYHIRSSIPAVTHVDFTARVQTVSKETNPRFWKLLYTFKKKSGVGMLINTSFNVRGEPIVCSLEDAYACFMHTEMDILVLENHIFIKTEQAEWNNPKKWKKEFILD